MAPLLLWLVLMVDALPAPVKDAGKAFLPGPCVSMFHDLEAQATHRNWRVTTWP